MVFFPVLDCCGVHVLSCLIICRKVWLITKLIKYWNKINLDSFYFFMTVTEFVQFVIIWSKILLLRCSFLPETVFLLCCTFLPKTVFLLRCAFLPKTVFVTQYFSA